MSSKPWYAWFPADYRLKTSHLSFVEDSSYRRLLDAYYSRGGPLPANKLALYRIASAMDKPECDAIDRVASEFFHEVNGLLHHQRCDEQLAKEEQVRQGWVEAGRKGGLSSAQARVKQGFKGGSRVGSTIPQSHSQPHSDSQKSTTLLSKLNGSPFLRDAMLILQFLNEKAGRAYRGNVNLEIIVARLRDGATVDDCRAVIAKKCREWASDEKMVLYLRPATLFNRTKFSQYQGELVGGDDGMS